MRKYGPRELVAISWSESVKTHMIELTYSTPSGEILPFAETITPPLLISK